MLTAPFRGARRRSARQPHATPRRPVVPRLGVLEDRTLPSTLTVTNLADAGDGSLRGQLAAAAPGDTIAFAPDLHGTIALGSALTLEAPRILNGPIGGGSPASFSTRRSPPASFSPIYHLTRGRPLTKLTLGVYCVYATSPTGGAKEGHRHESCVDRSGAADPAGR